MKLFYTIIIGLSLVFSFVPAFAYAQSGVTPQAQPSGVTPGGSSGTYTLQDPLGVANFCDLVLKLLNIVMAIGVPVAVLFLVWAGFRFILARGSQTGLADAKKNFYFVIIGIAVFLGAWTLATIIAKTIQTIGPSVQLCTNTTA